MRYLALTLFLCACTKPKYNCDREAYNAFVLECASHSGDSVGRCEWKAGELFCAVAR